MKYRFLIVSIVMILLLACNEENESKNIEENNCDLDTLISADVYSNSPNDQLFINNLEISDNCLQITFSASGCDGNSWEFNLIDSEQIMESFPIQRNLRLSLENNELCAAVITKTVSFDISELQIQDNNQVYLNITNSNDQILYEY